jgi:hypothetical protein
MAQWNQFVFHNFFLRFCHREVAAKFCVRVVPVPSSVIATTSFQWFGLLCRNAMPDLIELMANFDLIDRMDDFLST